MASITIDLPDGIHLKLAEKAAQNGQSLAAFLRGLLESEAATVKEFRVLKEPPPPVQRLTDEEFARWRAELKERKLPPLPALPDDFSREDIYSDHD